MKIARSNRRPRPARRLIRAAVAAAAIGLTPTANAGGILGDYIEPAAVECGPCDDATSGIFCDVGGGCGLGGCATGGDPYTLFGEYCGYSIGGWVQTGWHDDGLPLFNSRPNEYQLHQAWVYAEKAVDGSCGFSLGGRADYLYGTDSQDTQAFGIDNTHWDNQWDNGPDYGHALPQLYLEAEYGDWNAKVGKFFTIIGYEVVPATGNFFYSHAWTMYNSEPFTHTGALLTYNFSDDIDVFGGYVFGWDSGFEDNGDAVLGGAAVQLTDDIEVINNFVAGRFADNGGGNERGGMNSLVAIVQLNECWQYVIQNDILDTEGPDGSTARETFGVNQYLFREVNDFVSIGARFEWWNVEEASVGFHGADALGVDAFDFNDDIDIYQLTLGANVRPHANVVFRPEIRADWLFGRDDFFAASDNVFLDDADGYQITIGIDSIVTY